jgi:hypothetical protein
MHLSTPEVGKLDFGGGDDDGDIKSNVDDDGECECECEWSEDCDVGGRPSAHQNKQSYLTKNRLHSNRSPEQRHCACYPKQSHNHLDVPISSSSCVK